ncbi:putative quinol monooxygenase [Saccharibacillus sp. CPCC 101409]|uniref:putative quinol monooxygenase n=1 Tax=Saccharibacillus sp. CPCC 101409 TaxID=3058041 RepID=UPI002672BDE8|nr:putative quinol monooxygenase [Saccharibacillus sp. CPCC 101409]MDO3411648.1 putative quinol monooxygenase [Saccharibacillus sp. CPCC 101409]
MIIVHAEFQVDPTKEEAFVNDLKPLIAASQAEEGNISYSLHKSVDREHVYTMVELWRDREATGIHNQSEHFTSFVAKAGQYLTAAPEIKAFEGEPLS